MRYPGTDRGHRVIIRGRYFNYDESLANESWFSYLSSSKDNNYTVQELFTSQLDTPILHLIRRPISFEQLLVNIS